MRLLVWFVIIWSEWHRDASSFFVLEREGAQPLLSSGRHHVFPVRSGNDGDDYESCEEAIFISRNWYRKLIKKKKIFFQKWTAVLYSNVNFDRTASDSDSYWGITQFSQQYIIKWKIGWIFVGLFAGIWYRMQC